MNAQLANFAQYYRIVNISATTTYQTISKLLTAAAAVHPPGLILQITLKSATSFKLKDGYNGGDEITVAADTYKTIPALDAIDLLIQSTSGTITVDVELLYQDDVIKE